MKEIVIKITGACLFKAGIKLFLCSFFRKRQRGEQLCCNGEAFPRMSFHKGFSRGFFGAKIDMCRVEVSEACIQKQVYHFTGLL